jgi:hypothetical protein
LAGRAGCEREPLHVKAVSDIGAALTLSLSKAGGLFVDLAEELCA